MTRAAATACPLAGAATGAQVVATGMRLAVSELYWGSALTFIAALGQVKLHALQVLPVRMAVQSVSTAHVWS